jgi:hypothetical protein
MEKFEVERYYIEDGYVEYREKVIMEVDKVEHIGSKECVDEEFNDVNEIDEYRIHVNGKCYNVIVQETKGYPGWKYREWKEVVVRYGDVVCDIRKLPFVKVVS